jgi:hypothetical protein
MSIFDFFHRPWTWCHRILAKLFRRFSQDQNLQNTLQALPTYTIPHTSDLLDVKIPVTREQAHIRSETRLPLVPVATNYLFTPSNPVPPAESFSRGASESRDPALDLVAGCVITPVSFFRLLSVLVRLPYIQRNMYTALDMLTVGTNGINIIGVVTHLKEMTVTSSGGELVAHLARCSYTYDAV